MTTWSRSSEFWSCFIFLVWDIMASAAVASRLFSLNQGQATFLGTAVLLFGALGTTTVLGVVAKWKAANPDNPAPVGRILFFGLAWLALALQAVFPYVARPR